MTSKVITTEPTYTAIDDHTLMEEQDLGNSRSLIHIFNFTTREISTIYEVEIYKYANGSDLLSTSMNITDFPDNNGTQIDYIKSMEDKLDELLNPPDEHPAKPSLDYEPEPSSGPSLGL